MARIPQEVIDEIRSQTNIVEIVGQYVQLKKAGKNYSGLCPFHNEKTPSFSVAEDKQIFHCFGCGKGGNVFTFIQEVDGLSFVEAVNKVAEMEQIPLAAQYQQQQLVNQQSSKRQQLIHLHEKAAEVYHHMLVNTQAGQEALTYLTERGLTEDIIREFQIGFAPNQRTFLEAVLKNEQLDDRLFAESGLFITRDSGEIVDRFYQRIMFPVRDAQGKTIAFSGRWLATADYEGADQPKYLNSPETNIFNKRDCLFNMDKARKTARQDSTLYLFEGFMDVIAAWQAGIQSGVASMGTSLTNQQIQLIERIAKTIVICYDGDNAGLHATQRAIELLQAQSQLDIATIDLPERLDPDEYVRRYGKEAFVQLAQHQRETVFAFQMRYRKLERNLTNEKEQLDYLQELLHDLTRVPSIIEQDKYLTKLASEFQVSRESLQQQLQQLQQVQRQQLQQQVPAPYEPQMPPTVEPTVRNNKKTQLQKAEELLLYRLFHEPLWHQRFKTLDLQFPHDHYQEVYVLFDMYMDVAGDFSVAQFLDLLQEESLRQTVIAIENLNVPLESNEREFHDLIRLIESSRVVASLDEKKRALQDAQRTGNQELELQLAMEIIHITKELKNTSR